MKRAVSIMAAALVVVVLMGSLCMTALAAGSETPNPGNESAKEYRRPTVSADSSASKEHDFKQKSVARVNSISIAASVLGKSEDEVKESVKAGKVGDLLIAAGKVDEFKVAYLSETKSKLDAAVAEGTLTKEQADEKYAEKQAEMNAYDGTTHLCGGKDHSKMFKGKSAGDKV